MGQQDVAQHARPRRRWLARATLVVIALWACWGAWLGHAPVAAVWSEYNGLTVRSSDHAKLQRYVCPDLAGEPIRQPMVVATDRGLAYWSPVDQNLVSVAADGIVRIHVVAPLQPPWEVCRLSASPGSVYVNTRRALDHAARAVLVVDLATEQAHLLQGAAEARASLSSHVLGVRRTSGFELLEGTHSTPLPAVPDDVWDWDVDGAGGTLYYAAGLGLRSVSSAGGHAVRYVSLGEPHTVQTVPERNAVWVMETRPLGVAIVREVRRTGWPRPIVGSGAVQAVPIGTCTPTIRSALRWLPRDTSDDA